MFGVHNGARVCDRQAVHARTGCLLHSSYLPAKLLWLATAPPEPMWSRLAVVSGFFALTVLVCAAVLPSRLRSLNRAFGIESVMEVHRFLGISAAVLVFGLVGAVLTLKRRKTSRVSIA